MSKYIIYINGFLAIIFIVFCIWVPKTNKLPLHRSLNTDYVKLTVTYTPNDAPSVTTGPSDNGSSGTAPTNVGANTTFSATSSDAQSDSWKLLVCSTSTAPTASTTTPTCAGGDGNKYCVSSGWVAANAENTCTRTAVGGDAESNTWYAFACDNNAGPVCSTSTQGTGDNGTPFSVNHVPGFTNIADTPDPIDPGATIAFYATSSDTDTDTTADTVRLLVCKTSGVSSTACDGGAGDTWCGITAASSSNPNCTSTASGVGSNNYYAYIFDNHDSTSTDNPRSSTFTVNNATPTVGTISVGGFSLIEGSTTTATSTATVSDNNGYGDITSVTAVFYDSSAASSTCSSDGNDCYTSITCATSSCSDLQCTATCTANPWYYANASSNWKWQIKAIDASSASSTNSSATTTINALTGLSVSTPIDYGTVFFGETSSQATSTITNSGNTRIDMSITGDNMTCGVGTLAASLQHYSLNTGFSYGDGSVLKTTSPGTCSYMPIGISGASAVYKDSNEVYIFGGYNNTNSTFNSAVYSFDPSDTTKLALSTGYSLPQGLMYAPACLNAAGTKAYIFGGYWLDASTTAQYTDQIVEYDIASGAATSTGIGDLPVQLSNASCALNTSDSKIYIFGGWDNNPGLAFNSTIYKFDPASVSSDAVDTTHDLPQALSDAPAVYDSTSEKFYIFGGYWLDGSNDAQYTNQIVQYNPTNGTATYTGIGDLPVQLMGASAVYKGSNEIYVFGGYSNTISDWSDKIYSFDPSSASTNAATSSNVLPQKMQDSPVTYDPIQDSYHLFGGFYGSSTVYYLNEIVEWTPNIFIDFDLDLLARTNGVSTDDLYWKLQIPSSGIGGSCSGANYFTAIYDLDSD